MKKTVFTKSVLRVLSLGLFFMVMGLASCSSENWGIRGCYSAIVSVTVNDVDTISASIIEAPNGISDNQPLVGHYAIILKSDLKNSDIQEKDTIDFIITHYEKLPDPIVKTWDRLWPPRWYCRVKPCE